MGLLDTNKIIPLEKTISSTTPISISTIGVVGDAIETTGYKEAILYIYFQNTSSAEIELRGASKNTVSINPLLDTVSVYDKSTKVTKISSLGVYIIDLSNTDVLRFNNAKAVEGATFMYNLTLRQRSDSNVLNTINTHVAKMSGAKVMLLNSSLCYVTKTGNNLVISNVDVSNYRFFVVRARTMISSSEAGYIGRNFTVFPEWIMQKVNNETATGHTGIFGNTIVTGRESYNILSEWCEVMSPSLNIYISVSGVTPTAENPVLFHLDIIGIR